ncbi:hypothetical protein AB3S75_009879 [Citrus x aurantiifolia]
MGWDGTRTGKNEPGYRIECLKNDSHFLHRENIKASRQKYAKVFLSQLLLLLGLNLSGGCRAKRTNFGCYPFRSHCWNLGFKVSSC